MHIVPADPDRTDRIAAIDHACRRSPRDSGTRDAAHVRGRLTTGTRRRAAAPFGAPTPLPIPPLGPLPPPFSPEQPPSSAPAAALAGKNVSLNVPASRETPRIFVGPIHETTSAIDCRARAPDEIREGMARSRTLHRQNSDAKRPQRRRTSSPSGLLLCCALSIGSPRRSGNARLASARAMIYCHGPRNVRGAAGARRSTKSHHRTGKAAGARRDES